MDLAKQFHPGADWTRFPGAELICKGLIDLEHGEESEESLLVEISASKLRQLGFEIAVPRRPLPEHALFQRLVTADPDRAHSRYNALLRRLASFHRSARCGG
ncbi:MAG: hypothetical protein ABI689_06215 [Thermoanaerobaculia bacterium]